MKTKFSVLFWWCFILYVILARVLQYYLTFKIATYMIHVIVKKSRCKQHDIVRSKWKMPILKLRLVNNESVQVNISGILQQAKNKNKIGLKSVDNHSPSVLFYLFAGSICCLQKASHGTGEYLSWRSEYTRAKCPRSHGTVH